MKFTLDLFRNTYCPDCIEKATCTHKTTTTTALYEERHLRTKAS